MKQPSATPLPDLPEIIQRYLNGESLPQLAKVCGVARRTIYNWMYELGPDQYEALKKQAYFNRIADADEALMNAHDMLHVARAREDCRFARWDAERRLPAYFGPKQEISGSQKVVVVVQRSTNPVLASSTTYDVSPVAHQVLPLSGHSPSNGESSTESTTSDEL